MKFKQGKKSTEKEDINYICKARSFVEETVPGLGFRSRIFSQIKVLTIGVRTGSHLEGTTKAKAQRMKKHELYLGIVNNLDIQGNSK